MIFSHGNYLRICYLIGSGKQQQKQQKYVNEMFLLRCNAMLFLKKISCHHHKILFCQLPYILLWCELLIST